MGYKPVTKYIPENIKDGYGEMVKPVPSRPVRVIKSLQRRYGYSLQWVGKNPPTWIMGANHTWAWYRYKRDATEAASRYNKEG